MVLRFRYCQTRIRCKYRIVSEDFLRQTSFMYRNLNTIHRASKPTRPEKARRLGYKATQGFVVYRIKIRR